MVWPLQVAALEAPLPGIPKTAVAVAAPDIEMASFVSKRSIGSDGSATSCGSKAAGETAAGSDIQTADGAVQQQQQQQEPAADVATNATSHHSAVAEKMESAAVSASKLAIELSAEFVPAVSGSCEPHPQLGAGSRSCEPTPQSGAGSGSYGNGSGDRPHIHGWRVSAA